MAGPYKGAPLSLVVVIPGGLGPVRPRQRRRPRGDPCRSGRPPRSRRPPTPCRRSSKASRCARGRSGSTSIAPTSRSTRPTATRSRSTPTVTGDEGASSHLAQPLPGRQLRQPPYEPKMTLKLSGGLKRRGHPAIHAVITSHPGEANTRRVVGGPPKWRAARQLPHRDRLHQPGLRRRQMPRRLAARRAPKCSHRCSTRPCVARSTCAPPNTGCPTSSLDLKGQFNVEASGRVDSFKGRLRTTFETVPDVPVSKIIVDLAGGKKGLVANSEGLCGSPKRATVKLTGQNEVSLVSRPQFETSCGSQSSRKRHANRRRAR